VGMGESWDARQGTGAGRGVDGGVGGRNRAGIMQDKLKEPACEMRVPKCD